MDIVTGSVEGRDALRVFLRADHLPDEELQDVWDASVDATYRWIKPGYNLDAPAGVVQFVLNVAAHIWRSRDTGGDIQALPDGSWSTGASITSNLVRRYAPLGGRYVRSPRVVA